MRVTEAPLPGVKIIEAERFEDERGWFRELWNAKRYRAAGLDVTFTQDNVSWSRRGVLRGMHYQTPNGQGKLVTVLSGAVFDAVVDIRRGSPTFGGWFGCELSMETGRQLWVPPGFAHGFLVLSDHALLHYDCTVEYEASGDRALAWDDPGIGIEWPHPPEQVSEKDRTAPRLSAIPAAHLPSYG